MKVEFLKLNLHFGHLDGSRQRMSSVVYRVLLGRHTGKDDKQMNISVCVEELAKFDLAFFLAASLTTSPIRLVRPVI